MSVLMCTMTSSVAAFICLCLSVHCVCLHCTVNKPGSYSVLGPSGSPAAVTCPPDSFSPRQRKQHACVPCPAGTSTNGQAGAAAPSACGEQGLPSRRCHTAQGLSKQCAPCCPPAVRCDRTRQLHSMPCMSWRRYPGVGGCVCGSLMSEMPALHRMLACVRHIMQLSLRVLPEGTWPGGALPPRRVPNSPD